MVKSPFIALFRGGGRNHLLLSLLDNSRHLGCYTVRPLCRPEKGHRDLTSLSIVAVRAGWWLLKLISLHPQPRVGMRRQLRKQQVTMGLADKLLEKPTPKASSPSGGGSWHVVPDGRGICKALGTVVFFPTGNTHPNPARHPTQYPQSALRAASLRPATSVGVQPTNRAQPLLRLTTAGR